ncbi:unnamed protein product [Echinostoma caproni]|uniref:PDZ domain-containing protein n=1 Tax=Echinostoma caproni TaxID=27848 RepID=A0A183A0M2_9TREM|nr:unnamed protein product [Echinostoma caproni]
MVIVDNNLHFNLRFVWLNIRALIGKLGGSLHGIGISVPQKLTSAIHEPTVIQPEWEYLEVVLKRETNSPGGFGFSIAGGVDAPISDMDSGIYVTRINANGVADLDGRLRCVMRIVSELGCCCCKNVWAVMKYNMKYNMTIRKEFYGDVKRSLSPSRPIKGLPYNTQWGKSRGGGGVRTHPRDDHLVTLPTDHHSYCTRLSKFLSDMCDTQGMRNPSSYNYHFFYDPVNEFLFSTIKC